MAVGCSEKMVVYGLYISVDPFCWMFFLGGDRIDWIENDVSCACLMSILVVFDLFLDV